MFYAIQPGGMVELWLALWPHSEKFLLRLICGAFLRLSLYVSSLWLTSDQSRVSPASCPMQLGLAPYGLIILPEPKGYFIAVYWNLMCITWRDFKRQTMILYISLLIHSFSFIVSSVFVKCRTKQRFVSSQIIVSGTLNEILYGKQPWCDNMFYMTSLTKMNIKMDQYYLSLISVCIPEQYFSSCLCQR